MKLVLCLLIALSASSPALADDSVYITNGQITTKYEALKALLLDKNAKVQKCDMQEITSKGTLRKK